MGGQWDALPLRGAGRAPNEAWWRMSYLVGELAGVSLKQAPESSKAPFPGCIRKPFCIHFQTVPIFCLPATAPKTPASLGTGTQTVGNCWALLKGQEACVQDLPCSPGPAGFQSEVGDRTMGLSSTLESQYSLGIDSRESL